MEFSDCLGEWQLAKLIETTIPSLAPHMHLLEYHTTPGGPFCVLRLKHKVLVLTSSASVSLTCELLTLRCVKGPFIFVKVSSRSSFAEVVVAKLLLGQHRCTSWLTARILGNVVLMEC